MINKVSVIDEDDLDYLNEVGVATDAPTFQQKLVLRGIATAEEVQIVCSLCSKEELEDSLPLFIEYNKDICKAGYMSLTLDNILTLLFMYQDYSLVIETSEGSIPVSILSPQLSALDLVTNLTNLISL